MLAFRQTSFVQCLLFCPSSYFLCIGQSEIWLFLCNSAQKASIPESPLSLSISLSLSLSLPLSLPLSYSHTEYSKNKVSVGDEGAPFREMSPFRHTSMKSGYLPVHTAGSKCHFLLVIFLLLLSPPPDKPFNVLFCFSSFPSIISQHSGRCFMAEHHINRVYFNSKVKKN